LKNNKKCHSCEGKNLSIQNLFTLYKNKKRWRKSAPNISIVGASLVGALKNCHSCGGRNLTEPNPSSLLITLPLWEGQNIFRYFGEG